MALLLINQPDANFLRNHICKVICGQSWLKTNCKEIPFKLPLDHAPFFCSASNKLSVVQGPVKKDNLSVKLATKRKKEATPKETRSPVGYGDLQLKVVVIADTTAKS